MGAFECTVKSGEERTLNKGLYMDKELKLLVGMELRMQMIDSREDVLRTNKLVNVKKMIISLNELVNSVNLEDG